MFRSRATATRRRQDLDQPLRLVSTSAFVGLALVIVVIVGGSLWLFGGKVAVKASAVGVVVNPPGNAPVASPVDGVVAGPLLAVGAPVTPGQAVAEIRRDDGTVVVVVAPIAGTVVGHDSGAFAPVKAGDLVATIAPNTEPMAAIVFVSARSVADVVPGQRVEVAPDTVDVGRTGVLEGEVAEVAPLPATRGRLDLVFGDDRLVEGLLADGPVHEVVVELFEDPSKPQRLAWSGPGPVDGPPLVSGALVAAQLVVREQAPWQALLGIDGGSGGGSGGGRPADTKGASAPTGPQVLPVGATVTVGGVTLELEVARTPAEQATGLMFRTELADDRGMVFVFGEPRPVAFWMKDTLIPLDLIYLRDGVVVGIVAEAPPCEGDPCPNYPSPGDADTVVELAAGRAAELGIVVGSPLPISYR